LNFLLETALLPSAILSYPPVQFLPTIRVLLRDAQPLKKEDANMGELIKLVLQDILTVPEGDITIPLHQSSFKPEHKPPLEVRDVLFG